MIPIDVKNLPRKPPAAAPIMAAGENTPPNKPKPMHNDVANNLSTNNINKNPSVYLPSKIILISVAPLPRISGTKIATTPHNNAAISARVRGEKPVFAPIAAD